MGVKSLNAYTYFYTCGDPHLHKILPRPLAVTLKCDKTKQVY